MSVVASDIGLEDKHLKAVIQRVSQAQVTVNGQCTGKIERLMVLFGAQHEDSIEELQWLVNKVLNLRIFSDEMGKNEFKRLRREG